MGCSSSSPSEKSVNSQTRANPSANQASQNRPSSSNQQRNGSSSQPASGRGSTSQVPSNSRVTNISSGSGRDSGSREVSPRSVSTAAQAPSLGGIFSDVDVALEQESPSRNDLIKSRIQGKVADNFDDETEVEGDDKLMPLPPTKVNQPSFQAETNGVKWANLYVNTDESEKVVIGHGSFGTVVRAKLRQYRNELKYDEITNQPSVIQVISDVDVAVKVLTRGQGAVMSDKEFQKICDKAFQEVHVLQEAESKMLYRDCIIRTYGIARGPLPDELSSLFGMQAGIEGVGIVMRFEGGGSLESYLSKQRSLADKLRILEGIARGLTELHGLGIVHSDIKPDNVLLSSDTPPEVRLADFGLSVLRDNTTNVSQMVMTNTSRGTPIYFAPEMLNNPYKVMPKKGIAQSSRKTDIYAFALLSWEVLTQNQAFFDVETEGELCATVHKGQRPPIEQIPRNCPGGVINTVKACWDTDRNKRKTAIECLTIYQFYYGITSKKRFDIFFSHSPSKTPISTFVMQHLIRLGYRVFYDQDSSEAMTPTREATLIDGITRSSVVIAFATPQYQENMKCMLELKSARTMLPQKPIITLAAEPDPLTWGTKLLLDLTQIRVKPHADISGITASLFETEVPSGDKLVTLQQMLQPVMKMLMEANCTPSLDVLGKIAD